MISFFLLFLLSLTTIIFLFSFLRRGPRLPLPPGPKPLPIIGNMLMMAQLTHRGLASLADRYGGLFHLKLGFLHTITISTPEMAKQVLQIQDNIFSNRPATIAISYLTYNRADMAFAHYGPFWRQIRKLCVTKLFSRKRAESWASVREEVNSAIKNIAFKIATPVNLGEVVFNLTMNITLRAAFGTQSRENETQFIAILQEFSKLFGAFNIGDFIPWLKWFDLNGINKRLKKARLELDWYIDRIIEDHRNPKEVDAEGFDMVDDMLTFFVDPTVENGANHVKDLQGFLKLSKDNIKAIIMDVMFGGTETVASAIEWTISEILRSPEELKRIQAELDQVVGLDRMVRESDLEKLRYLKCAIKESLRLHPPIPLLLHETSEDTTISGYFIPARTRVMINVWAIGRNKSAWKDPDEFRPARFDDNGTDAAVDFRGNFFELLPFGSGRRSCPGMQLGLYGLELAVANLIHCFEWELPGGIKPSELSMSDVFGLTAPKAERLVAVPKPRLTCPLADSDFGCE